MLKHSLLGDLVFEATAASGVGSRLSLPAVLASLSAGDDLAFARLRPHQRPAWHAFLVQLAFLALEEDESASIQADAAEWARRLRNLTSNYSDDAPWCLVNTDWQQPAFLQAPCSKGREADFNKSADSVQDIDLLVTSRHHDEKAGKLPLAQAPIDTIVYALVVLQGWASFMGAGNYNSMRMNGGFSSRPQFRLAFGRGSGAEFVRDVAALREGADRWLARAEEAGIGSAQDRHALLWLPVWDSGSLALAQVHPLCLEVCRRVRLQSAGGALTLRRASSDAMRISAKSQAGCVHDPWIPVMLDGSPRALTAQPHTLSYRSLQAVLFDRRHTEMPILARPSARERSAGAPATLLAQVLISGDGRTDGLAVRELPMPPEALRRFADEPVSVAERARAFVELAGVVGGKVYRSALIQFMDGSEKVAWKNRDFVRAVEPWSERFEAAIDGAFFTLLFDSFGLAEDEHAALQRWAAWLENAAWEHLALAADSLPTRDTARVFARARAERFMHFALAKHLPGLRARRSNPEPEEVAHDL
jgi:CRISPR system Cascade subunit CasA